jgi:hypothetical protein
MSSSDLLPTIVSVDGDVWSLPDPAKFTGSNVERAALLNELYASLHRRISIFINCPWQNSTEWR